jgi:hypothetical protein
MKILIFVRKAKPPQLSTGARFVAMGEINAILSLSGGGRGTATNPSAFYQKFFFAFFVPKKKKKICRFFSALNF